jgi:hypothetical protein
MNMPAVPTKSGRQSNMVRFNSEESFVQTLTQNTTGPKSTEAASVVPLRNSPKQCFKVSPLWCGLMVYVGIYEQLIEAHAVVAVGGRAGASLQG